MKDILKKYLVRALLRVLPTGSTVTVLCPSNVKGDYVKFNVNARTAALAEGQTYITFDHSHLETSIHKAYVSALAETLSDIEMLHKIDNNK